MASRAERREAARTEAKVKLVVFGLIGLALAIGGLSGFAGALTALVFLAVVVGAAGLAGFLILKSQLVGRKKLGLLLVLGALLTGWFWYGTRAPRQWPEERATVASVSGPTAETETDYEYKPAEARGAALLMTQKKSWSKLSEAKSYRPGATVIFYDRSNPAAARFEAGNGLVRMVANPVATRIRMTGQGTATLRFGSPLFPKTATTTGPHVVDYVVGTTVPVWINPISQSELSFSPRATDGGQKYWTAVLAGVLALGGVGALVIGREWIEVAPLAPPNAALVRPGASEVAPSVSIADRLHAIDWFQFEAVAARVLEADGWTVERSGGAKPDGGADIVATRSGRKAVVQCKHWRRVEVQPKIIRELLGTKASAQFAADEAILVTLSACTEAALACARENNVVIYDAGAVEAAVERLGLDRFPELTNPDRKLCPKCGAAMVFREKAASPFWGCSTFPRCRGTIERAY